MTTIGLVANDQLLVVVLNPKVSSGDQNTVSIHVDFSEDWNGFTKSAVFFTSNDTDTVYEKIMNDGECIVPAEVMAESCILYIGVRGVNSENNEVKTTSLVKYKILEGTPSGTGTEVEPTPDVYQQILTAYGKTQDEIAIERNRINESIKEVNLGRTLKFWLGSEEEYNAIPEKINNCLYITNKPTVLYTSNAYANEGDTIEFDASKHSLFAITLRMQIVSCVVFCGKANNTGGQSYKLNGSNVVFNSDKTPIYFGVSIKLGSNNTHEVEVARYSTNADYSGTGKVMISEIKGIM